MAQIGEIIDGKYEILREMSKGNVSVLYLAIDKTRNEQWYVREIPKKIGDVSRQGAARALIAEATMMMGVRHPALTAVVNVVDNGTAVYIVTEYVHGQSLDTMLEACGPQPQKIVIEWAKQISDVLDYLHTKNVPIIYRNLRPDNIILKQDGTVKLVDLCTSVENGNPNSAGCRGYIAPEFISGRNRGDGRSDVYSLGVTMHRLLTGKDPGVAPYEIFPIRRYDSEFLSGLEWLIQKCTQLTPDNRYQSCAEVSYVLKNLNKFDVKYKKKLKRRIRTFAVSIVLAVILAVASAVLLFGSVFLKQNAYDDYIKSEDYVSAIELDDKRAEAYTGLIDHLGSGVTTVVEDKSEGSEDKGDTVTVGDIDSWFSDERMANLKAEHLSEYVQVQYDLGILMWNGYDGDEDESMKASMPYFKNVLSVLSDGTKAEDVGLDENSVELVKNFYSLAFLQASRSELNKNGKDGDVKYTEVENFVGIKKEQVTKDFLYTYIWNASKNVFELIYGNDAIPQLVRIRTCGVLNYVLRENYRKYNRDADIGYDEMEQFAKDIRISLMAVNTADGIQKDIQESVKGEIDKTIKDEIGPMTDKMKETDDVSDNGASEGGDE